MARLHKEDTHRDCLVQPYSTVTHGFPEEDARGAGTAHPCARRSAWGLRGWRRGFEVAIARHLGQSNEESTLAGERIPRMSGEHVVDHENIAFCPRERVLDILVYRENRRHGVV